MSPAQSQQSAKLSGDEPRAFSLGRMLMQPVKLWPPSELAKLSLFPQEQQRGGRHEPKPITVGQATNEMFKIAREAEPRRLFMQGCFAAVDIAAQLATPLLSGALVLALQSGSLARTMAVVAGMGVVWGALKARELISEVVVPRFNMALGHTIERQLFELVANKSMSSITQSEVNADLVRVREQTHRVADFVRRNFDLVRSGTVFGGACLLTATASPAIAATLLACGVMRFTAEIRSSKRHQRAEDIAAPRRRVYWGERWNVINSEGVSEIKNHLREGIFAKRVQESAQRLDRPFHTERLMRIADMATSTVFSWVAMVSGSVMVGYQAATGTLGVDIAVQVMGLIVAMEMAQANFARQWNEHLKDFSYVKAFLGLRDKGKSELDPSTQYRRIPARHVPKIEYQEARFAAKDNGHTKEIVKGVSFVLEPGKMYGLCGPSGQGKTSIIKLLTLENELTAGNIKIDGVDLASVHPHDVHRTILYLPQTYYVFAGLTTSESIAVGLQSEGEGIGRAIDLAEATFMNSDSDVRRARMWKDAPRGREFSGGEKQRIALARALARHRGVIIVDEPTAQLDPKLAEKVITNLRRLANDGNTVVLISHDMLNIALCDKILFVKGGEIAESGSHAELLAQQKEYAAIWSEFEQRRQSVQAGDKEANS
ncbi:MAG: ABC transporter ATP-binding protein [Bdellovibrionota bacterium]|nr:MAG: ABC transporter ATP-binding protein [Bdellovibrionota bacterium]